MPISNRDDDDKPEARLDFARRLRERRVLNGFRTARSLARAIGIDENRYTRYERAEVEPDLTLIRQLALALNTTPNDLLGLGSPGPASGLDGAVMQSPPDGGGNFKVVMPSRVERSSALLWSLADVVAGARAAAAGDGRDTAGPSRLQAVSAVYQQLAPDPYGTIAALVNERAFIAAPADVQARIHGLIDELTRALSDSTSAV